MSARGGSEPIAGAKVIISSELTKKSQQKVSFDRKREDFGSIFWQERRNIVFLQKEKKCTMATEGYKSKQYNQPTKRFVQTMELKDDSELIKKYKEAHDKEHFWEEIKQGIQAVGILEMEIYILGNRLVMIVDAPLDFDWDTAMAKLATLPRQEEWEKHVAEFQDCAANATSDQKWQMMERMFYLYE